MMATMAKKVELKNSVIKMLTPETFNLDVKKLSAKMPVMDAILHYCEQNKLPDSNIDHLKRVTYVVECMQKSLQTGEVICPSKKY